MVEKRFHIVYKTTCTITNHYYFGVHSTNNIEDGYIGSGIKFLNYVKKYGRDCFVRSVLQLCPTRAAAFKFEKELLTEELLQDPMCLNLIEGGIGYAHEYNETCRSRISLTRKIRIANGKIIPTKHSEEHKQKLREHNPGGEATAKPIYQIDGSTGDVIKEWKSMRQAGLELNIKSWRNISTAANKNKIQTVGGFYWRWVRDPEVSNNKLTNIEELNKIRLDSGSRAGKRIQQLDDQGHVIKTWKSMCEAGRHFGLSDSTICAAIKTSSKSAGFYWRKS